MPSVQPCGLPPGALLARYAGPAPGAYTDSFVMEVPGAVSLPAFVEAFYASPAFWLELFVVGLLFRKPWSAPLARRLAAGDTQTFSAWRIEDRTEDQILMYETISGKTRSWLMVQPRPGATQPVTDVYFGTAVLPVGTRPDGNPRMSLLFAMVGFHRAYSRVLLRAAWAGLARGR